MKVFVAGATGAIGRVLVPLLLNSGHEVVAISRSQSGCNALLAGGATAVLCDVFDVGRLNDVFRETRPDAVIHQMTSIPSDMHPRRIRNDMEATNRLRVQGTGILLDAARLAGARRFIAQSIAFAYRPLGAAPATEDVPLYRDAPASFATMIGAVRRCEYQVLHTSDIDGTVLRYGYFYGPGTIYARGGSFAEQVRGRRIPIVGRGTGVLSFIHIADAATATVRALHKGVCGTYNICDDEPVAVREWLPSYAELLGAKPPFRVPAVLGHIAGGSYLSYMMNEQPGAANALAKGVLEWQPEYASWRNGFRAELSRRHDAGVGQDNPS